LSFRAAVVVVDLGELRKQVRTSDDEDMGVETDFLGPRRRKDIVLWRIFITGALGALGWGTYGPRSSGNELQAIGQSLSDLRKEIAVLTISTVDKNNYQDGKLEDHENRIRDIERRR
jgi:hypothetical protein